MEDLFAREQQVLDDAVKHLNQIRSGNPFNPKEYEAITLEYGKLLKLLRRVTKISDRTTYDLNERKLDLLEITHFDALTKLYNRRFMEETMDRMIKSLSRSGGILSVLMADIDNFKKYNDTYGHTMGDQCLKEIANALNDSITRANDFVVRYGGEEFLIVLPDTDESGARMVANRILEKVKVCNIPHGENDAAHCVTISVGATTGIADYTQKPEDYIECADKALYMSKKSGRDKYTFIDFEVTRGEKNDC